MGALIEAERPRRAMAARPDPANMRYIQHALHPTCATSMAQRAPLIPMRDIGELDGEGIDPVFLYPTVTLGLRLVEDPALAGAICRAYNRYIVDFCDPYPDRLFGVAAFPCNPSKVRSEELCYAADVLGLRRAFICPNPYMGRLLSNPSSINCGRLPKIGVCPLPCMKAPGDAAASQGRVPLGAPARVGQSETWAHIASHTIEMMLASLNSFGKASVTSTPISAPPFLESGGGWMAGWLAILARRWPDR